MPIEFHCNRCGMLVRAPDDAGGKWGRCPMCHQSVYVPMPDEKIEPLDLAPVDESEEQRRRRLEREAIELERALLADRNPPPEMAAGSSPASGLEGVLEPKPDIETLVLEYAVAMADGDLARAEELAVEIRRDLKAAEEVMQRLTLDEVPHPQLAAIPRPVLVGFFKQLRQGGA